jgi:hypothetical protein
MFCYTIMKLCITLLENVNKSRSSAGNLSLTVPGRAVMLEQPRKTGVKVQSHMLASHGGEIFIHILPTSRSILEDPPSISEGCGGRVTDYRITVSISKQWVKLYEETL